MKLLGATTISKPNLQFLKKNDINKCLLHILLKNLLLFLGVFIKPHKPHKPQKLHQNRPQNSITAPHRTILHGTMRFAALYKKTA